MSCLWMGRIYCQDSGGDPLSRPICWVDNSDETRCFWNRSWKELYHFVWNNAPAEFTALMMEWLEGEEE